MNRPRALMVSELLATKGFAHTIQVGVHTGQEHYRVALAPISFSPDEIAQLVKLMQSVNFGLSYDSGAFYAIEDES